jgi:hypothetical protein
LFFLLPAIAGIANVMLIIIMIAITLFSQLVLTIVFFIIFTFLIVILSFCVQTPMFWITVQSYGESMGFENENSYSEGAVFLKRHRDFP